MKDYSRIDREMKKLKGSVTDEEILDLFLLITGEKPGALVMDPDRDDFRSIKKLLKKENTVYRVYGDEKGLISRILGGEIYLDSRGVFIANTEERFQILEQSDGDFYGFDSKSVGRFLGYPDTAIEHYLKVKVPGKDTIEEVKTAFPEKELRFLALVSYIPKPDEEAIDKAINEGKDRFRKVEDNDAEFMEQIAERLMEKSIWN